MFGFFNNYYHNSEFMSLLRKMLDILKKLYKIIFINSLKIKSVPQNKLPHIVKLFYCSSFPKTIMKSLRIN